MASKSIDLFSLSFLDMISGALGAVLILFIIIPHHKKEATSETPIVQKSAEGKAIKLDKCLFVRIEWQTEDQDVDLMVVDPSGKQYSFLVYIPANEGQVFRLK